MANMERIGGLYIKKSKEGNTYLSGKIREEKVLVFKNKNKKTDKHPDYVVMLPSEKEPGQEGQDQGDDVPF